MSIKPFFKLFQNGQLSAFTGINALFKNFYKLSYLAAAKNSGLLDLLSHGPTSAAELAETYCKDAKGHEALDAWLQLGVRLKFLELNRRGYVLKVWQGNWRCLRMTRRWPWFRKWRTFITN